MTIYLNTLKRLLRRKANLLFIFLIPIVLISFVVSMTNNSEKVTIGFVDKDKTFISEDIRKTLEAKAYIKNINENEIQEKLISQSVTCVFLIEKGFTKSITKGDDEKVKSYSLKETNLSVPFVFSVEAYLKSLRQIGKMSNGDVTKFQKGFESYKNGSFISQFESLETQKGNKVVSLQSLGFLVMCMLFLSSLAPMILIEDKDNKTLFRILSGPVTQKKYMMYNLLSFFTILFVQITLIFIISTKILKIDFGTNLNSIYIVSLIFSLFCVALGVAINSLSKDLKQSGLLTSIILTPMCMLGGAWWPLEIMPELLRKISDFIPVTWVMRAYEKLVEGAAFMDISKELIVLILFIGMCFLLPTWKKQDIAK